MDDVMLMMRRIYHVIVFHGHYEPTMIKEHLCRQMKKDKKCEQMVRNEIPSQNPTNLTRSK